MKSHLTLSELIAELQKLADAGHDDLPVAVSTYDRDGRCELKDIGEVSLEHDFVLMTPTK